MEALSDGGDSALATWVGSGAGFVAGLLRSRLGCDAAAAVGGGGILTTGGSIIGLVEAALPEPQGPGLEVEAAGLVFSYDSQRRRASVRRTIPPLSFSISYHRAGSSVLPYTFAFGYCRNALSNFGSAGG